MKENLRRRVSRIISGSFNALVDAIEGSAPELVLEETLREVDGTIDETRAEMGKRVAEKYTANKQLSDKHAHYEKLQQQITLAVKEGRDDLAEAAISKQLDIEAQLPFLEQAIKEATDKEKELEGFIQALQAKKREFREELNAFSIARAQTGSTKDSNHPGSAKKATAHKVNHALDKASSVFERVLSKQGHVYANQSHDASTEAKLQELEKLSRENRIKERLAVVKTRGFDDKS